MASMLTASEAAVIAVVIFRISPSLCVIREAAGIGREVRDGRLWCGVSVCAAALTRMRCTDWCDLSALDHLLFCSGVWPSRRTEGARSCIAAQIGHVERSAEARYSSRLLPTDEASSPRLS